MDVLIYQKQKRLLILFREDYNVEGTSVSFGGRVMLINSILVAIPIYYLSFMKMPLKCGRKWWLFKGIFCGVGCWEGKRLCGMGGCLPV